MHALLSQPKVLIRGGSSTSSITQGESGWLDLRDYQHAVVWLAVDAVTAAQGSVKIAYQTAPRPDDSLFVNLSGNVTTMPLTVATGITVTTLFKDYLSQPLARWFRWQLTPSGVTPPWDVEFQLYVCASGLMRRGRGQARPLDVWGGGGANGSRQSVGHGHG